MATLFPQAGPASAVNRFFQLGSLKGLVDPAIPTLPLEPAPPVLPLSVTKVTVSEDGADDTIVSGSFTPANGSLLVAIFSCVTPDNTAPATTISSTAGLTWTQRVNASGLDGGYRARVQMWTAPVVTGVSMTVTCDDNRIGADGGAGMQLVVLEITGHDAAAPVGAVLNDGAGGGRSGVYNGVLGAAPAASSVVFSSSSMDAGTWTAASEDSGAGWATLYEAGSGLQGSLTQQRGGSASTNVNMGTLTTGFSWAVGAMEIKVAPAVVAPSGQPAAVLIGL